VTFPCARIEAGALRHNLSVVRKLAPHSRVMAVIKANAYGHGIVPAAKALASADALAVARLSEALTVRAAGITNRIVLLEGVFSVEELAAVVHHQFDIVVHSRKQLAMLEQWRGGQNLSLWLKLDSGMNRLGFRLEHFPDIWPRMQALRPRELRLMTHLATADDRNDPRTLEQVRQFEQHTRGIAAERSVANSAGLIAWPDSRLDWVRPGLMLYGISPVIGAVAKDYDLKPAMTLTTSTIAVGKVGKGEAVGYGGAWRAQRDSLIGIAAVGYGDGYPRSMRSGAPVLVRDHIVPVVGRVSMDMIAIDLTEHPDVADGETVVLWGEGLPAERVAEFADTIPYELVCGVSQRVSLDWRD
jgi:alanine racemase